MDTPDSGGAGQEKLGRMITYRIKGTFARYELVCTQRWRGAFGGVIAPTEEIVWVVKGYHVIDVWRPAGRPRTGEWPSYKHIRDWVLALLDTLLPRWNVALTRSHVGARL